MSGGPKKVHDMRSLAEQILDIDDTVSEKVYVPEWEKTLWVRNLSGAARNSIEQSVMDSKGKQDGNVFRARLLQPTVIGEDGRPVFSFDQIVILLNEKNTVAIERLVDVAMRLAGIRVADVEKITKNSAPGPSAGSTSN